jgi:hypothetical protein
MQVIPLVLVLSLCCRIQASYIITLGMRIIHHYARRMSVYAHAATLKQSHIHLKHRIYAERTRLIHAMQSTQG